MLGTEAEGPVPPPTEATCVLVWSKAAGGGTAALVAADRLETLRLPGGCGSMAVSLTL